MEKEGLWRELLNFAVRFAHPNADQTIKQVLRTYKRKGLSAVLSGQGESAQDFLRMAAEVRHELHKTFRNLIAHPYGPRVLYAHTQFRHEIGDLVVRHLAGLYPDREIYLVAGVFVWVSRRGRGNLIYKETRDEVAVRYPGIFMAPEARYSVAMPS